MVTIDDNDLRGILIDAKLNSTGQYICTCLFCGKPKHMYISQKTQRWDCKKCGSNGNIVTILKHVNRLDLIDEPIVEFKTRIQSIREAAEELNESVEEDYTVNSIKLPIGWKLALNNEYLFSRKLSNEDIRFYELGVTNIVPELTNYIIASVKEGGVVVGYVGRYGHKNVPKNKLRYNNSKNVDFSKIIYGIDEVIKNKTHTVIIVEGIFDKFAVDRFLDLRNVDEIKCVCTFGKKFSKYQQGKLKLKNVNNIIMLYDIDAIREIKKISFEVQRLFTTNIIFTNKKDIDECSAQEAMEVFSNIYSPERFYSTVAAKLKK